MARETLGVAEAVDSGSAHRHRNHIRRNPMVKKVQKSATARTKKTAAASAAPASVKDSAQQIWLAGLAAFTKAQNEGGKLFETLVKEGLAIQRKTQAVAEEKINEATNKMANMATGITTKATGQWDKLETIFEERVARALNKLGVPSAKDVEALIARIEDLNHSVQKLSGKAAPAATKPTAKPAAKPATPRAPAAKKAAARPAEEAPRAKRSRATAAPAAQPAERPARPARKRAAASTKVATAPEMKPEAAESAATNA
jgi:poly(hydroxyalkanoate) granule-associated protein